jgi:hypothetical protein
MSLFSLPLHSWQRQQSVLSSRKRKSTEENVPDFPQSGEETTLSGEELAGSSANVKALSQTYGESSDVSQHRLAGLDPDEPIPRPPFPHTPISQRKTSRRKYITPEEELQYLNPPLYLPDSFARGASLRMQHFAVVSTILHRCLFEGDYVRASRAWGMMLRDEFGGLAVDIRTDGRWGIGAEILLHRNAQVARARTMATTELREDTRDRSEGSFIPWFTRQGFEDAERYYRRIILQYPYDMKQAKSICALDFYPAMYALWIYIVQAEAKIAREQIDLETASEGHASQETEAEQIALKRELKGAADIAADLDRLMTSPPYSDYGELLRLRGMVALWIGDLQYPRKSPNKENIAMETESSEDVTKTESQSETKGGDDETMALAKQESLIFAKRCFEDAKRRGVKLPLSIESLLEDEDEEIMA